MGRAQPPDHLTWAETVVDGRQVTYGVAGTGTPVLFLHGWALGHHAYKRALKRVVNLGCRVYAPALPGFGGTADLPGSEFSFAGFGGWVNRFLGSIGLEEPVVAVGHSFGGGVAIKLAHDHPGRVRQLVLVSSLGAPAWSHGGSRLRLLAERPLWDWGLHFPLDLFPVRGSARLLATLLEDALPNLVRNPLALWRAGNLARSADLLPELEALAGRDLPIVVLWGDKDTIVPRASFESLCRAVGSEGNVVAGHRHLWLLGDPDAFGEAMAFAVQGSEEAGSGGPVDGPGSGGPVDGAGSGGPVDGAGSGGPVDGPGSRGPVGGAPVGSGGPGPRSDLRRAQTEAGR